MYKNIRLFDCTNAGILMEVVGRDAACERTRPRHSKKRIDAALSTRSKKTENSTRPLVKLSHRSTSSGLTSTVACAMTSHASSRCICCQCAERATQWRFDARLTAMSKSTKPVRQLAACEVKEQWPERKGLQGRRYDAK